MARIRGELVLAWAAALVGIIGIVSALTPEFANRSDFVRGVLPPGVPGAARIAALTFGLTLIWLSRSLAQRRRRAWQLAIVLVVGLAIAHLVKGLDFEESTLSLLVVAALLRFRKRFDVPGDPLFVRPLVVTALAFATSSALVVVLDLRGFRGDRVEDLLAAATIVLGFRALHLWLRPISERVRQSAEERRLVRRIVRTHGDDSLAFFSLRRDKSYFFSPTRKSFVAYKVVGGCALVSGDPVGDKAEVPELLAEFRRVCRARGWRLALLSVRAELVPVARSLGLRAIKIGDEAVVRPANFSLEGRPIRKVRQSVTRLEREGYSFRVVAAADVDQNLRLELEQVSAAWRGANVERGFSMAMDDQFGEPDTFFAIAQRGNEIGGFLHLVPSVRGYSLGAMRRRRDTPNGLMEYLIAQLLGWARAREAEEISLNFCVFADLIADTPRNRVLALARAGLRIGDRLFQLERLLVFSRKFAPEWRPRYLCVERLADLPQVGMAYLRVESLLTPPGPWARQRPVSLAPLE
ncbi:MAG: phosphatidylglycerol lysyltransferase domain-containing protein [Gaiellaceae bacterium]